MTGPLVVDGDMGNTEVATSTINIVILKARRLTGRAVTNMR